MSLSFYVSQTGAVICQNHKGMIFFLPGEPFNCVRAAKPSHRAAAPHKAMAASDPRVGAPA